MQESPEPEETDVGGSTPDPADDPSSSSSLIPVVAGSIGAVVAVLIFILCVVLCYRPKKRTVYDLYGNEPNDLLPPEDTYVKEDADIIAGINANRPTMQRTVSYGGQGDII